MITQYFDLNMIPDSEPVVVHVNQYDTGTGRLVASLYNGETPYTPTGTAAIQGTKPDGIGFMYSATLSGNTVTADLKDQMSVVAGHVRCQIVISETSGTTGTFCFDLDVQESALPDDAEISESDYPIIEELIQEAQEAAAIAATAEVNAEASAEDSEAWAVGTRGGDPVPSTDPTYHNNSKYWAEHGGGGTGGHTIMDENGDDMPARNTLQFVNMDVTDDSAHGITVVTGSRGVLPYLYIDSEAGSTVTVVAPDSSVITPTAAGSGHWECEVPGYGVYVIHSVLDSEDATVSVTIDSVKEYHITDSHYEYTINITAQVGATVRVACGTEIYTGTGTGSPVAFVVHQASATYTLTATLDGVTDTQTVTSASTTGQSTSVTLHIFTATLNISTEAQELAGATITITKGGSTVGTASFPASGTLTVNYTVHETGSYTASVTYSGETYSDTQPVSTETTVNFVIVTIPEGSTVLPTDDIQTWLKCAGLDKAYTTLSEVLADHDTLYILMGDDNAVDYLVRSTTWATGITADETAMRYIGKWNYASDTLLDDSTWASAIGNSAYIESVLNVSVPLMTGASAPSGTAFAKNNATNWEPYKAFNRTVGYQLEWQSSSETTGTEHRSQYVGYQFPSAAVIKAVQITNRIGTQASTYNPVEYSLEGSNSGQDTGYTTIADFNGNTTITRSGENDIVTVNMFDNDTAYSYYRITNLKMNGSVANANVPNVQFYGRQDVTENLIDIYSAAGDTVTITPQSGSAITCVTDSTGHGTVAKNDMPAGTYTLSSIIAKDPSNLSNDYTKTVTITEGTSEVYFMPDGEVLYWYGYKPNEFVAYAYKASGVSQGVNAPTISQSGTDLRIAQAQKADYPRGIATTNVLYDVTNYTQIKAIGKTNAHSLVGVPQLTSAIQNNYTVTSTSGVNYSSDNVYECVYSTPNSGVTQGYVLINVNCGSTAVVALNLSALWLE